MTSKQKIITTGTILLIFSLMIYLFFRVSLIEKDFIKSIRKSSEKIFNTYRTFDERRGDNRNRSSELEKMATTINKKIKNLSLLVIAGLDYKIDISSRNNRSIKTHIYEKILYEFANGKIRVPDNSEYIIRYYGSESQEKVDEDRFYLFSKIINKSRIFLVYKYMADQKSIVKIAIESGLIILFFIISTSLVFIISVKSKGVSVANDDTDLFEVPNSFDIDVEKNETLLNNTRKTASSSTKNAAQNAMNTYIYELFAIISKKFHPESLALFTHLSENLFTKSHELKENSFKVIESKTFDTFNLNNDVYRELKKKRIMIMDSGTKSIIPVINDNSLLGFIQFVREKALNKDEISTIRNELGAVAGHLSEYLVVNNIMIDSRTGLFSETYFRLKYNEMLQLYRRNNTFFSIILISLFNNSSIPENRDQLSTIKTIALAINETIPVESFTCLYGDYLAIVLPGVNKDKCDELEEKISLALTRFKIKMKNGEKLMSEPLLTSSSTDPENEMNNPVEFALKKMKHLISSEKRRMQTPLI